MEAESVAETRHTQKIIWSYLSDLYETAVTMELPDVANIAVQAFRIITGTLAISQLAK